MKEDSKKQVYDNSMNKIKIQKKRNRIDDDDNVTE